MATRERDWTSLPRNVFACILDKFRTFDEYLLFGRVCKEWSRAVKDSKSWRELSNTRVPLMMVPCKNGPMNRRALYNVLDDKVCGLQISLQYEGRCCGSSHGWLATFGTDLAITLRNPFSGQSIHLPQIFARPPYEFTRAYPSLDYSSWMSKVILSEDPNDTSSDKCVVAVLYERHGWLAFMRLSDEGWTYVDPHLTYLFYDIIFYDGSLYAVEDRGKLIRIDISIGSYVEKEEGQLVVPRSFREQAIRPYILESSHGYMIMVRRFVEKMPPIESDLYLTTRCDVHKLVTTSEGSRWVEMENLEDEIIFLGDNHSESFSCSDFPGCEPNRIYFTDDSFEDGHYEMQGATDIGVFNVKHRNVEATYPVDLLDMELPPSIFLMPKLDDRLFLSQ